MAKTQRTSKKTSQWHKANAAMRQLCKEHGIDDDTRKTAMLRVVGKDSAADCSDRDLETVVRVLGGYASGRTGDWQPSNKPHVRKIWALWNDVCAKKLIKANNWKAQRAALQKFCKRQSGIDNVEWLSAQQANLVIEGIKQILKRGKE